MGKGRPKKYNHVSCQDKYKLRRLILKEKMSVKQAARTLNINYSTAKTIMFFFRKSNSISPQFLSKDQNSASPKYYASYKITKRPKPIQIITTVKIPQCYQNNGIYEETSEAKFVKKQQNF